MLTGQQEYDVQNAIEGLQRDIHNLAVSKDWWHEDRNDGEQMALMHSEISECLEALRKGNPQSIKIPGFTQAEEELADVVIRIMDHCESRGWNLAKAIVEKHKFNHNRPPKHGKLF